MKHVMLDFETLGTGSNACVIQIGACYFDAGTGEVGSTFYVNVDPTTAVKGGAEMDASTVYWWLGQSDAARASILDKSNVAEERTAFEHLNDFLSKAEFIWSHATFDFVILTNTLKRLGIKPSFSYRAGLDIRTLTFMSPPTETHVRNGVQHDAMSDCIYQVKYVSDCIRNIKGKR